MPFQIAGAGNNPGENKEQYEEKWREPLPVGKH
jgi:hypothetical protein